MFQSELVVNISHLHHTYPGRGPVLNVPQFQIKRGETVFLHGPSGSGKSTLLSLVTGILPIQKGHVKILGHSLEKLTSSQRDGLRAAHMGYIFQVFNLLPFLNVVENIVLPVQMNKKRAARLAKGVSAEDEARRLADKLSISHLLEAKAGQLSVGQQQRVAAARALMGHPDLIVADEPTSALDADLRETFLQTLFEQARQQHSAVLFVSHDRSLMPLFDRTVALGEINQIQKGEGA